MMATRRAGLGIELGDQLVGRVGVVEIVVGERLALHLRGGGDAEALLARAVERGRLMRVLAIAQRLGQPADDGARLRRRLAEPAGKPRGDRRVVGRGAGEGARRQRLPQRTRRRAAMRVHLGDHQRVVGGVDHDRDAVVVLGPGADHGRPADVDGLDAGGEIRAAGHRLLERIEIGGQEVDRVDRMIGERLEMRLVLAQREQPAMDLRMQRLDPPIHHLRQAGDLGDVDHLDAGLAQQLGRAAGRDDVDAVPAQVRGQNRPGRSCR